MAGILCSENRAGFFQAMDLTLKSTQTFLLRDEPAVEFVDVFGFFGELPN